LKKRIRKKITIKIMKTKIGIKTKPNQIINDEIKKNI
jgi:hypothetical protein